MSEKSGTNIDIDFTFIGLMLIVALFWETHQ